MGRPPRVDDAVPPPSGRVPGAYDGPLAAVFGLAAQITGDARVAETLTTDTFAAVHHLGPKPSDTLQACLVTDVHRRAVQWARQEASTHRVDATAVTAAAPGLRELPDDERTVIIDAYFGGCTYAEIAERHGLAPADVARLMQQGLRRLTATR